MQIDQDEPARSQTDEQEAANQPGGLDAHARKYWAELVTLAGVQKIGEPNNNVRIHGRQAVVGETVSGLFDRFKQTLGRAVHALAKPGTNVARRGEIVVQPYRGYGSLDRIFLVGRVVHQRPTSDRNQRTLSHKLKAIWHTMRRWGVANATLTVRFGAATRVVRTDRDGYFKVDLETSLPRSERLWHSVAIKLTDPVVVETEAEVFIPPDNTRFVVISDIDDTVMHTGVANKLMMMWRLFAHGAESRIAFPGMAAFLNALHRGPDNSDSNPMLYVSRAPWSIYGVLDEFFNQHDIPVGPILFLREWGLTLQSPLPRRTKGHKLKLIREMLSLYDGLRFVLIGDSGQRDPEIYSDIVRSHPKRVLAVYIRNAGHHQERDRAIATLAAEIADAGSSLVLAADTMAMARHAADIGLIDNKALEKMRPEEAGRLQKEHPQRPYTL